MYRCECLTKSSNFKTQCANNAIAGKKYCNKHIDCNNIVHISNSSQVVETKRQQYDIKLQQFKHNNLSQRDEKITDVILKCNDGDLIMSYVFLSKCNLKLIEGLTYNEEVIDLSEYSKTIVLNVLAEYNTGLINVTKIIVFEFDYNKNKEFFIENLKNDENIKLLCSFIEISLYLNYVNIDVFINTLYKHLLLFKSNRYNDSFVVFTILKMLLNLKLGTIYLLYNKGGKEKHYIFDNNSNMINVYYKDNYITNLILYINSYEMKDKKLIDKRNVNNIEKFVNSEKNRIDINYKNDNYDDYYEKIIDINYTNLPNKCENLTIICEKNETIDINDPELIKNIGVSYSNRKKNITIELPYVKKARVTYIIENALKNRTYELPKIVTNYYSNNIIVVDRNNAIIEISLYLRISYDLKINLLKDLILFWHLNYVHQLVEFFEHKESSLYSSSLYLQIYINLLFLSKLPISIKNIIYGTVRNNFCYTDINGEYVKILSDNYIYMFINLVKYYNLYHNKLTNRIDDPMNKDSYKIINNFIASERLRLNISDELLE